jgi:hypothetical protein
MSGLNQRVVRFDPIFAWHLCHVALILPLASALYLKDGDLEAVASDRTLLKTTMRAAVQGLGIVRQTAPLNKAYEDPGFIIAGKSNMPEHGAPPTTEPKLFDPCHNSRNLKHSPDGSSGDSAAAVAMGYMPIAHANDGG